MHCSILVDPQEAKAIQARDHIHSQREMHQELLKASYGLIIRRQAPPILSNHVRTDHKYIGQGVRETVGPQHLSHQPQRPSGVRDNHVCPTGEILSASGVTGVHKSDAWEDSDLESRSMQGKKWKP